MSAYGTKQTSVCAASMSALEVKRTKVYRDLDFWSPTWLNNFPLSVGGHLSPCCRPLRVARAGRRGFFDHIVPAAIAFDCEARYVLSYGDLVTARVMCPTGNNPEDS